MSEERGRDKHMNKAEQDGDRDVKERRQTEIRECENQ